MCNQISEFIEHALVNHPRLTSTDLRIYRAILILGENAYRSDIAAHAEASEKKVSETTARLELCGLISVERRQVEPVQPGSPKTKNFYSIPKPMLPSRNIAPPCTNTTTEIETEKMEIDLEQQMVLVEDDNLQNLGAMDIEAQKNLKQLGINPNIKQMGDFAPALCRKYSPGQILMFCDKNGDIKRNLARWRAAMDAGAYMSDLTPALIWVRIVEGQPPPEVEPSSAHSGEDQLYDDILAEARRRAPANARGLEELVKSAKERAENDGRWEKWRIQFDYPYHDAVGIIANEAVGELPARGY